MSRGDVARAAAEQLDDEAALRAMADSGVAPEHRGALLTLLRTGGHAETVEPLEELLADHAHWRLYVLSRHGDARAATRFEKHWRQNVLRFCGAKFRRDETDEIASAFFERVYRLVRDEFAWHCTFSAYLRTVLVNVSRDHLRRVISRRERETTLGSVATRLAASPLAGPERRLLQGERDARVRDALLQLTPADRHLVRRTLVEGESGQELADELGMTRDAIYQRVSRARARLRTLLKELP